MVKVSTRGDTVYTFSSIEKEEYNRLYDFFKAKKIAVKSVSHKKDKSCHFNLLNRLIFS